MTGIIECYKRIYANKKIHIQLLIIAIVWSILSNLLDIKTGNSLRQNIIDLIFNIFIGAYSLQFLHNSVNNFNNFRLPSFKEIKPKIYLDMIKLNIVWGIYAILCMLFVVFTYMMFHKLILPAIVTGAILFVSVFVYYIYLAYAESLNTK